MCGRFASFSPPAEMLDMFRSVNPLVTTAPRYNISPTQEVLAVRLDGAGGGRRLGPLRWGLIPGWAKDPAIPAGMINARAETLAEKPSFREAFRRRRCLIPADVFYEWKAGSKPKQPWAIRRRDGGVMAFAGLWERWQRPGGPVIESCAIVTTRANAVLAPLHDRMPVIIEAGDFALWLGEETAPADGLARLLQPLADSVLEAYPVNPAVNSPRNDGPGLLA